MAPAKLPVALDRAQKQRAPEGWVPFRIQAKGKKADIYIFSEIGYWGVRAQDIANELKLIKDATEITIHINSPGGEVFDGFAMYSLLAAHPAKKITKNYALAASMGSVLFMLGEERLMAQNSRVMIHEPSGACWGTAEELRQQADLIDSLKEDIANTYHQVTTQPLDRIKEWMKTDTYFSVSEAREYGFSTGEFTPTSVNASLFNPEPIQAQLDLPEPPPPMIKLLQALGLAATATEEQALERLAEIKKAADPEAHKAALEAARTEGRHAAAVEAARRHNALTDAQAKTYGDLLKVSEASANEYLGSVSTVASLHGVTHRSLGASEAKGPVDHMPGISADRKGWTFQEFDKKDPIGLQKLKAEHPNTFKALFKAAFGQEPNF